MSRGAMAERVLARNAGLARVRPGEIVDARVDVICVNEQFARLHDHMVEAGFEGGLPRIHAPERVHLMLDHYQPALNAAQARRQVALRRLAAHYGLTNFTDAVCGVIHRIAMEAIVRPGEVGLCNDSHGTAWGALGAFGTGVGEHDLAHALIFGDLWFKVPGTVRVRLAGAFSPGVGAKDAMLALAAREGADFALYRSLEFAGPGAEAMGIDGRTAMASHAVEVGAKFGLFAWDDVAAAFVARWRPDAEDLADAAVEMDPRAEVEAEIALDLGAFGPHVALPSRFGRAAPVAAAAGTRIDQAVIGSCANGMAEDLAVAAEVLERAGGVARGVRLFVQPASWGVHREAMRAGLVERLLDAGGQVLAPGCHLCQGRQGHLAAGETCITSTTRNHRGRMGEPGAEVYLAGSATVAASAAAGRIADPREVLR